MDYTRFPHRDFDLTPKHITYRLHGSIPIQVLEQRRAEREQALQELESVVHELGKNDLENYQKIQATSIQQKFETQLDNYLHDESNGPYHLAKPEIAKEVINSWKFLHDDGSIFLYTICVMSNHVHVVASGPKTGSITPIGEVMRRHKNFTAKKCNKILHQPGQPFWDPTYFDRDVRDGKFNTVVWYVLNNPWQAGISKSWADFPHIWLNPEYHELFKSY